MWTFQGLVVGCFGNDWQFLSQDYFPTKTYESQYEISNNVVCATNKGSDQPAHMHSLVRAFPSRLNIL